MPSCLCCTCPAHPEPTLHKTQQTFMCLAAAVYSLSFVPGKWLHTGVLSRARSGAQPSSLRRYSSAPRSTPAACGTPFCACAKRAGSDRTDMRPATATKRASQRRPCHHQWEYLQNRESTKALLRAAPAPLWRGCRFAAEPAAGGMFPRSDLSWRARL